MGYHNNNDGCGIIMFIGFAIMGLIAGFANFPEVTIVIVLIVIIGGFIFFAIVKEQNRKLSEKNRREQEERVRLAEQARIKREQEEKQRLEELKYETAEVVFIYTNEDKKPRAIIKRSNNTYCLVVRTGNPPYFPYTIGELLKLLREATNTWNWINEHQYQREKETILQNEQARQMRIAEKNRREQEERLRLEEQARVIREQAEKQRLEELKYETVEVVFVYTDEDKKPRAAVKRSNNTYEFVQRGGIPPYSPYIVGELIKLLRETTNTWNWVDEHNYQREKETILQRNRELEREKELSQKKSILQRVINSTTLTIDSDYSEDIGKRSETYIYKILCDKYGSKNVKWLNEKVESYAHHDFEILDNVGNILQYVECKGTIRNKSTFYLTLKEWFNFLNNKEKYQLYRVFNLDEEIEYLFIENLFESLIKGEVVPCLTSPEVLKEKRVFLTLLNDDERVRIKYDRFDDDLPF